MRSGASLDFFDHLERPKSHIRGWNDHSRLYVHLVPVNFEVMKQGLTIARTMLRVYAGAINNSRWRRPIRGLGVNSGHT